MLWVDLGAAFFGRAQIGILPCASKQPPGAIWCSVWAINVRAMTA